MNVLIVGSGPSLFFLCRTFISRGYRVAVIDPDREECENLSRNLKATVINGDGSDPSLLHDAGAREADVLLALTPRDQDNLVICQVAGLSCGVPRTIALANDPDNAEVFEKLGISAFSLTSLIASLIQQRAANEQITNLFPFGEGNVFLTELLLDFASPVTGKLLKDIELPDNALVAVVIRDEEAIVPRGNSQLLPGDRVVVITTPENHGPVLRCLTGERN